MNIPRQVPFEQFLSFPYIHSQSRFIINRIFNSFMQIKFHTLFYLPLIKFFQFSITPI